MRLYRVPVSGGGPLDDMIVVRGLNVFPTMVGAVVSGIAALTSDFRIVLTTPPPHDVLPVHVELATEHPPGAGLAEQIARQFKQALGVTAKVTVLPKGSFEVTEGKTRRVIRSYQ